MTDSNPNNFKTTKEAMDFVNDFFNTPFEDIDNDYNDKLGMNVGTLSDPPLVYEGEKNANGHYVIKYEIRGDDEFGYYISGPNNGWTPDELSTSEEFSTFEEALSYVQNIKL